MLSWIKLDHLVQWTGASVQGAAPSSAQGISIHTDTRTLKPGQVFLALRGPSFDGNEYVKAAAEKGAIAAIVERPIKEVALTQLVVKDSLKALVSIGEQIRKAFQGPVMAITGSAGKSSTKEMVADLLGKKTLRSPKSFNNLLGVPLTLCGLEDSTENVVLEMGMNALGELAEICHHFPPSCGAITNIGDAHIGKMGGKEKIFQAKKELFDSLALRPDSRVALNLDDPWVVKAYQEAFSSQPETVTYSVTGQAADVQVLSRQMDPKSGALSLQLRIRGSDASFALNLFGLHQASNIAAACASGLLFGLSSQDIFERLPHLKSTSQRGELVGLSDGKTLIDESYNSNPSALISSMESVSELDNTRRHVLVLGEMRELGEFSDELHSKAGQALVDFYLKKKFPLLLVGVGNGFLPFLSTVERKLPAIPCLAVPDTSHAIERLKALVRPGDIILVKGSRGVALEAVVNWLKSS